MNSALEVAPRRGISRRRRRLLTEVEAFFRRSVEAGQAEGTIATQQSADDLARLLLGALLGICVLARVRPERDLLQGFVRPVFALLDGMSAPSG